MSTALAVIILFNILFAVMVLKPQRAKGDQV